MSIEGAIILAKCINVYKYYVKEWGKEYRTPCI